ncbi:flagellar hook-basal body complex protein [Clostridium sp.]|uniref:flagellar hook-basal body complex protein n=1 Tax=Clostridium sp. TaxID=1506 RepID=UPI003463B3DE
MLRILWNSKSGMAANQDKLDAISNNLANLGTDGYKRVNVSFKSLMSETLNRQGYPIAENGNRAQDPYTGTGVRSDAWTRENIQGPLIDTKKSTDIAIEGEGYYRVTRADGSEAYTRSGAFIVDEAGRLVDSRGNLLYVEYEEGFNGNNVNLSENNLIVDNNGNIFKNENNTVVQVGRIPVFNAVGSNGMIPVGESLYEVSPEANLYEVQDSLIHQGFLEGSNVDMAKEFTDMILTQRAFELSSKGLKTADDMWGMVNNIRGR